MHRKTRRFTYFHVESLRFPGAVQRFPETVSGRAVCTKCRRTESRKFSGCAYWIVQEQETNSFLLNHCLALMMMSTAGACETECGYQCS